MGALLKIDDAERMARIWISTMDTVTIDRHIGEAGLRHDEQLVNGPLEAVENLHGLVSRRINEQDLGAHFVDADHPMHSFFFGHDRSTRYIWQTLISMVAGKCCREGS